MIISVITAVGQHPSSPLIWDLLDFANILLYNETASMSSVFSPPIILYVVLFDRVRHKVMSYYASYHKVRRKVYAYYKHVCVRRARLVRIHKVLAYRRYKPTISMFALGVQLSTYT